MTEAPAPGNDPHFPHPKQPLTPSPPPTPTPAPPPASAQDSRSAPDSAKGPLPEPAPAPGKPVAGWRGWGAVGAVALGIFCLITSELLPVGLLTPVGADLGVSDGTAGLMVTVPGLVAGFCAPLVTVGAGRLDRRWVLVVLIALMVVANLVAAVAPGFGVLLAARVLVGVSVGGFWAIAGGLAVRLVPEHHVGRATALVFGGVPTASVLGVPAGTLLGDLGGWRFAFAAVGGLGILTLTALVLLLPPLPPTRTITFAQLPALLRRNRAVRAGVAVTFLVVTGQFAAYTFVRPILQDVSGVQAAYVSTLLLGYGVAGVAGNFLAGARDPYRTLFTVGAALSVILALIATVPGAVAGTVLLLVWGLVYGGVSVSLQSWMIKAAPDEAEAASSLMVAMFNLAIAAGALSGGLAVDGISVPAAPLAGAVLMALAAVTVRVTATARTGTGRRGGIAAGGGGAAGTGSGDQAGSREASPADQR